MPSVRFRNVSFSYTSAVDLLADVDFALGPGWVGLVGANGSGKSTLLALMTGDLKPQNGSVTIDGAVSWCPQSVDELTSSVRRLGASDSSHDYQLRGRLRLEPDSIERWDTLSPGERRRWQVGAALALRPDVLLLDEPTNHLDREGHATLHRALWRFAGVGVLVSHDRAFLDLVTTKTLRIAGGTVVAWNAPYSRAKDEWEAQDATERSSYETIKREQRKTERRLADQRRVAETERARTRRRFRTSGPKDHDAHSAAATGKAAGGDAAGSKAIGVTRERAERLAAEAAGFDPSRDLGSDFFFDFEPARRRRLLSFTGAVAAGARELVATVDCRVERGDRIRLAGRNGAGKTTLIGQLVDSSDLGSERLLYLPQETTPGDAAALVRDLMELPAERRGRVLQVVAALGADPKRILASDSLSAGEVRKLAMGLGMGTSAWCLVLDEPTNHLDLPSIERLEAALRAYPGALLMVTHDEHLAESVTDTAWTIANGRLTTEQ